MDTYGPCPKIVGSGVTNKKKKIVVKASVKLDLNFLDEKKTNDEQRKEMQKDRNTLLQE